jgi:hypothetical protein
VADRIYTVATPDGGTIDVQGPEGASPEEVSRQAQALYAQQMQAMQAKMGQAGGSRRGGAVAPPPAPDPTDPSTWPKDAGGQPMNPQAPQPQGMPTGLISPRVLAAGTVEPVAGAVQHAAGLAEAMGLAPKGATKSVTANAAALQGDIAGKSVESMSPDEVGAMHDIGMMTSFAVPLGAANKLGEMFKAGKAIQDSYKVAQVAKKVGAAVAEGAATGALGASTMLDPKVQSAWEANLGLGAGALLGAVIGPLQYLPTGVKNAVMKILRSEPTPESKASLEALRKSDIWKSAEERLTIGQKTGDPRVEVQEARTQGRRAAVVYNRQLDDAENRVLSIVQGAPTKDIAAMGEDLHQALYRSRIARQKAASAEYGASIDKAEALAKADPADSFGVKVSNFRQAITDAEVTPEQWQALYDNAPVKYRRAIREAIDMLDKNDGRMQLADMMKTHQALNTMRASLNGAQAAGRTLTASEASANRLAAELQNGLQQDIDHMDSVVGAARQHAADLGQPRAPGQMLPGEGYSAAWNEFKDARAAYADHINRERYIDATVLQKKFGMSPTDPAAAFRTIMDAPPAEQARMITELNTHFPGTIQDLKRWKLQDAVDRAFKQSEAGNKSAIDPKALIKELTAGKKVAGELMWTAKEKADIEAGVGYLRLIQSRSTLKDPGVELQRVGMAISSRSTPFLTGNLYKILVNPNMEKMFFTAKGREILRTLATAPKNTARYNAASGWLAAKLAEGMVTGGQTNADGQDTQTAGTP